MSIVSAEKNFNNGRFEKVIKILEPLIFENRSNGDFYYFLGYSYLHMGDFPKANSYLQRAAQLEPESLRLMYGNAVISLKKGDTAGAVKIWLDIRERNPNDILAGRGLDFLKGLEKGKIDESLTGEVLSGLIPGHGNRRRFVKRRALLASGILTSAVITLIILI